MLLSSLFEKTVNSSRNPTYASRHVACVLQGIHREEEGYKLTTPCVHSVDKRFGQTDKGSKGIRTVFAKHRCNNLCYTWPKPSDHLSVDADHLTASDNDSTDDGGSSCDDMEAKKVNSSVEFGAQSEGPTRVATVCNGDLASFANGVTD